MKKVLVFMTAATLCLSSLTACGGEKTSATEATTQETTTAAETTTAETTTAAPTTAAVTGNVAQTEALYSQDVNITNGTGVAILEMYFSLSEEDNWGEELLQGRSFDADMTMEFTAAQAGTEDTMWDIMAVDADGDKLTFQGVNLSSATDLYLHWGADGRTPTVSLSNGYEAQYSQDLDITNGTGVAINEVYISMSDDTNWGEDMLGNRVFAAGDTLRFTTEVVGNEYTLWDIRIIDADGDEVIFEGVDFSASEELNLNWGSDGRTPTVTMK